MLHYIPENLWILWDFPVGNSIEVVLFVFVFLRKNNCISFFSNSIFSHGICALVRHGTTSQILEWNWILSLSFLVSHWFYLGPFSPTETSIQKPSFKKEMMSLKGTKQFNVEIMNCLEQAFQAVYRRCCIREAFLNLFCLWGLLAVMIRSQAHLHKNCMYSSWYINVISKL